MGGFDVQTDISLNRFTSSIVMQICVHYVSIYTYIYIHIHVYIYIHTARTGVLPGEVRFDFAGPVCYEIRDVVHLSRWMTRFVSGT